MRSTSTAWYGSKSSDVPPRTASSAVMPSLRPFELTVSMKGAGKVFSRPTRSPMTFLFIPNVPSGAGDLACQVFAHHVLPVGPIVRPSRPDFEPDINALRPQQPGEPARVLDVRVLLAGGDHLRVLTAKRGEVGLVRQAGQELEEVREVDAVVVVAVEPARGVIGAAERDEPANSGGVARGQQHGMERAEGRAGRDRRAGQARKDLVDDVALVLEMPSHA